MSIARLGLAELTSLVETAFKRGYVDSWWTRFEHFRDNLAQAGTEQGRAKWIADDELTPFGDTTTELSCWAGFRNEAPEEERRGRHAGSQRGIAAAPRQPARSTKLGRNEPCPCMSGQEVQEVLRGGTTVRGASRPNRCTGR
jgi:hypothetical protein